MTIESKKEDGTETLKGIIGQLNNQVQSLTKQIEELTLHLEVANERWVKSVNENATLEVELRKLKKAQLQTTTPMAEPIVESEK